MSGTQRAPQRSDQRLEARPKITIRTARHRFQVDTSKIPVGMDYRWVAETILGQDQGENLANAEVNHWVAVPPERHPEVMGGRKTTEAVIRRGGQILMERPIEISRESAMIERMEAGRQYESQMQRLELMGHRAAGKGIKRNYEAVPDEV